MTSTDSPTLRRAVVGIPMLWLLLFALLPLVLTLKISLSQMQLGVPPYLPLWASGPEGQTLWQATIAPYTLVVSDSMYVDAYLNSLRIAGVSTLLALLISYPMAYGIVTAPKAWRTPLLLLALLPFWTSFLIRVYAWVGLLRPNGTLNSVLISSGLIDGPLRLMNTEFAVYLGMVFCYLPFMLLPLYARLERQDATLIEAACDLGATPRQAFWRITVPLSLPGVYAGCLLVFVPSVGEFVIPELLGGSDTLMIGKVLWNEFFLNRDWPVSSAVAVLLLMALVVPLSIFQVFGRRASRS
jgi:putrescine transport system permease protein